MRTEHVCRVLVLRNDGNVKRVYMVLGGKRDAEVAPSDGAGKIFILIFGVYHDNIGAEHKRPNNLKFRRVGFSGARLGKNGRIRVLKREAVKNNQTIVVHINAVQNPLVGGKVGRNKGKKRGRWPGI